MSSVPGSRAMVYPRAYGGTDLTRKLTGVLSRSIPARTGEPPATAPLDQAPEVYPRAYGETDDLSAMILNESGLSPRVRGNRFDIGPRGEAVRSIPARTGKPLCSGMTAVPKQSGLSPRVRGNPSRPCEQRTSKGSIPARTGEPRSSRRKAPMV